VPAVPVPAPAKGTALLATWHELLDAGSMQDGDEYLAGTAKRARALLSATTAAEVGIADGDLLSVSTERGALIVEAGTAPMPPGVVWLPTNARGCAVRSTLGAVPGTTVTLVRTDAPPVIAEDGS